MKTLYKAVEHLTRVGWQVVGYLNLKEEDLLKISKNEKIEHVELLTSYKNSISSMPVYYDSMVECLIKLSNEDEFSLNHVFNSDILEIDGKDYAVGINPVNKCVILEGRNSSILNIEDVLQNENGILTLKKNIRKKGNVHMLNWAETLKEEKGIFITI